MATPVKSARNTVAQSLPGYGLLAGVLTQIEGTAWYHYLVVVAIPVLDALVTGLSKAGVKRVGNVEVQTLDRYLSEVEKAVDQTGEQDTYPEDS